MKKIITVFLFIFTLFLVSCTKLKEDNNVPVFNNIIEGKLPELNLVVGTPFNLLSGISAKNSLDGKEANVSLSYFGDFDINKVGSYTIIYLATNNTGSTAKAERLVNVVEDINNEDNPIFDNVKNNFLPSLELNQNDDVDFYENVIAYDKNGILLDVNIINTDNFDNKIAGVYTFIYETVDKLGNRTLAYRKIIVNHSNIIKTDAFFINENHSPYILNNENALNYTSSGTQFRSFDQLQIMTKEFFTELFVKTKNEHRYNGSIPFFSSGVIVILDNNMKVKHMRLSSPLIEIDEKGIVKTSDLNWSNTIDSVNGGGNFSNIINTMDDLIPNGGYIVFAPPKDKQLSKQFLIKNLFDKNYVSGQIISSNYNIDINSLDIKFDVYEEIIEEDIYANEMKNTVITKDNYLDGIPITTYYYNDGNKKPVLFFFHGFGSERKSGISNRGKELAEQGFYVVSLDAYLHGERMPNYFKNLSYGDKQKEIVNIQIQTALDAKNLFKKHLASNKYIIIDEVYTFGVSMGAGSAIYLASILDEVKGVVSLLGSPSFVDFYSYKQKEYNWELNASYFNNLNSYIEHDPFLNHRLYGDKNIYFAGGSKDTVVPAIYAENFKNIYADNDNIIFKLYNTAHTSTNQMHSDVYKFLKEIKS